MKKKIKQFFKRSNLYSSIDPTWKNPHSKSYVGSILVPMVYFIVNRDDPSYKQITINDRVAIRFLGSNIDKAKFVI